MNASIIRNGIKTHATNKNSRKVPRAISHGWMRDRLLSDKSIHESSSTIVVTYNDSLEFFSIDFFSGIGWISVGGLFHADSGVWVGNGCAQVDNIGWV